jgi:hypothetical protein
VPPLAVVLRVDAAVANGVQWGGRLVLTAVMLFFPELKIELDQLGSGYNFDLMHDEMEVL